MIEFQGNGSNNVASFSTSLSIVALLIDICHWNYKQIISPDGYIETLRATFACGIFFVNSFFCHAFWVLPLFTRLVFASSLTTILFAFTFLLHLDVRLYVSRCRLKLSSSTQFSVALSKLLRVSNWRVYYMEYVLKEWLERTFNSRTFCR